MSSSQPNFTSKIWFDEAEKDNPFAANKSYCHGYDVYNDILNKASWAEYLFLLFVGEKPTKFQSSLLEKIAIVLCNPGLRDNSVRAAMNAGVGGSTAASSMISAIATGAGQYGGAREVYSLVESWHSNADDIEKWKKFLKNPNEQRQRVDLWNEYDHAPGFDVNSISCPNTVLSIMSSLCDESPNGAINWLNKNRQGLESHVGYPLSLTSVIAASFFDLGLSAKQSEMLFLILRLPGAAAHSLEQEELGWQKFPFFGKETHLTDDPGPHVNSIQGGGNV